MKTILVPTDFSEHALYALSVAAKIAKKMNAEIKLIHACNMPSYGFAEDIYLEREYNNQIKAQSEKKLNALVEMDILKGITVIKNCVTNMPMWELVTNQKYKDVDLIVMGSHGTSGFNKVFIGSNTEKIVRMVDSPVLTIKNEITDFKINKMVFASNFFKESYSVFEKIKFFADVFNAHIELLKVITPKDFESTPYSKKLLKDFAIKFQLKDYSINIYNGSSIEKGIIDFAEEINADLIAMETHGRTGFTHLINGSLAEDIVKHEVKPVLSIKIPTHSESALKFMDERIEYENWGNE